MISAGDDGLFDHGAGRHVTVAGRAGDAFGTTRHVWTRFRDAETPILTREPVTISGSVARHDRSPQVSRPR